MTESYRYRDWVVDALNRDLPYDQFIINQIAGDLIPPKEPGGVNVPGIVATGMLAIGNWGGGDADKEKLLTDIADDQVDVVSRAFLGLTVACARCHDHKFDPIPTEDYYSLGRHFLQHPHFARPRSENERSTHPAHPASAQGRVRPAPATGSAVAALEKQIKKTGNDRVAALANGLLPQTIGTVVAAWACEGHRSQLLQLQAELDALKQSLPPIAYANGVQEGGCPTEPASRRSMTCTSTSAAGTIGSASLSSRRFPRILAGDDQTPITQGSGRMELARWIASPHNPLTARVMVNRIWQHHFGEGNRPHAGQLRQARRAADPSGVARLPRPTNSFAPAGRSRRCTGPIMLSATYQQASTPAPETLKADPDNRCFGRMNRRRLEAEEVRGRTA